MWLKFSAMAAAKDKSSRRKKRAAHAAAPAKPLAFRAGVLLFLLAAAIYLPSWQGEFLWDDDTSVTESEIIQDPGGWWKAWVAPPHSHPDYFPLTTTSFWMEWHLWGDHPAPYRVANILLHATCALLLWRLLVAMGLPAAWWAAAIFAVHPVNVESVAWIAERKNLLAMVFAIPAFHAFVNWTESADSRSYWPALGFFALALAAKASVVALPLVFLGYLWWKNGKLPGLGDFRRVVPFLLLSLGFGLLVVHFQHTRAVGNWEIVMPGLLARLAGAVKSYWFYVGKVLWPFPLATIYPRAILEPVSFLSWVLVGMTLGGIGALWLGARPWSRSLAFGLTAYGLLLAPALGFIEMSFMKYSLVADHFQHLALPALIATVVCGCASLSQPFPVLVRRLPLVGTGVIVILASLTWSWAGVHATHEGLWRDQLAKFPKTSLAHNILGTILSGQGKLTQAEEHFRQASAMVPHDPIILTNLGTVTMAQGRDAEAAEWLRQTMRTRSGDPRAFISLAVLQIKGGDLEGGLDLLKEGAHRYPKNAEVTSAAGASLLLDDRPAEAIPFLTQCEQIEPRNAFVKWDLARAYEALGQHEQARTYRRAALELNPDL